MTARLLLPLALLIAVGPANAEGTGSQMTVGHAPPPSPTARPPVHYRPWWGLPRPVQRKPRCEQDRVITDDDPCSDNRSLDRRKKAED